jgi:anti-anti-sigma regulatory factor
VVVHALDGDEAGTSEPRRSTAPGDHVCTVVDGTEQLAGRVAAWVGEGLAAGERVVCVVRPDDDRHARWLTAAGIDWASAVDDGRLVLFPPNAAYGTFDDDRRLAQLATFIEQSLADGYPAVRMASEATVAVEAFPDLAGVLAYEEGFEALCHRYPVSGLCIYDRTAFEADLPAITQAHPRGVADDSFHGRVEGNCIRLSGELDLSNLDLLGALLTTPCPSPEIDIDVRGVTFIDVAATGALVEAARRWAPSARTRIVHPSRQLRTIVSVGGWAAELELVGGERG